MRIGSAELKYIFNNGIGLRAGTEAKNAAYALGDFGDFEPGPMRNPMFELARWMEKPEADSARLQRWHDALYNSVAKIDAFGDKPFNLILTTNSGTGGGGETYAVEAANPFRRGAGRTFAKTQVGEDADILASKTFDAGEVGEAVEWITTALQELAFFA